jgi:hypothetical protein
LVGDETSAALIEAAEAMLLIARRRAADLIIMVDNNVLNGRINIKRSAESKE